MCAASFTQTCVAASCTKTLNKLFSIVFVGAVKYFVPQAAFGNICCTKLSDPFEFETVGVFTKTLPLPPNTAIFLSQSNDFTVVPLKSNP